MHQEYFRLVVFKSCTGKFVAQCLEVGQMASGKTIDEAVNRALDQNIALLTHGEQEHMKPLVPASPEVWDIYRPTMIPFREISRRIEGHYDAVFRCYDITNAENPMNITTEDESEDDRGYD